MDKSCGRTIFDNPITTARSPMRSGHDNKHNDDNKPQAASLQIALLPGDLRGDRRRAAGHFYPEAGKHMKPLGDGFIKLIKMMIAPIIFCTVVIGIAGMEDMKKV